MHDRQQNIIGVLVGIWIQATTPKKISGFRPKIYGMKNKQIYNLINNYLHLFS